MITYFVKLMSIQRDLELLLFTLFFCIPWGDNVPENDSGQVDLPILKCRERGRLNVADEEDFFSLVDIPIGKTLILQCHFCSENDDKESKIWYKQKTVYNSKPQEVNLDMNTNTTLSRVYVDLEHSLIIKNITFEDSGLYLCEGLEGQESENKFNYYIDIIFEKNVPVETGDEEVWKKYFEENFYPINKLFRYVPEGYTVGTERIHCMIHRESPSPELVRLREDMRLTIELLIDWNSWTPCDACENPIDKGITQREGCCRIKIIPSNKNLALSKSRNEAEKNLISMDKVSCSSLAFFGLYPYIGSLTRVIPNFREIKFCKGTCTTKESFKYTKTYVLVQGSHLKITCPETSSETTILWRRNGKKLPLGDSVPPPDTDEEPHITVDTFGTLYLREVTSSEEGNYTCQVDEIRMQQVLVFVISKSKLLTEALVRHLVYLGVVLSLTVSCYCGGCVVVFRNRRNFKTYDELKDENDQKERLLTGRN